MKIWQLFADKLPHLPNLHYQSRTASIKNKTILFVDRKIAISQRVVNSPPSMSPHSSTKINLRAWAHPNCPYLWTTKITTAATIQKIFQCRILWITNLNSQIHLLSMRIPSWRIMRLSRNWPDSITYSRKLRI